jgi:hypothetical protein
MSIRFLAALLRGCVVGFLIVATVVIVHAVRHGWESVSQPGDWIEKVFLFLMFTGVYTLIYSRRNPPGKGA